jgi:hypothetical protein
MIPLFWLYIGALLLTIIVELLVAYMLGYRTLRAMGTVVLINILTNPLANLVVYEHAQHPIMPEVLLVLLLEVIIVCVEWMLLLGARVSGGSPCGGAVACNERCFVCGGRYHLWWSIDI